MIKVPNINSITSVYCDTARVVQLTFLILSTEHPQELALSCEVLDAMVSIIRNTHVHISSAITSYIVWLMELSLATALLPK